MDKQLTRTYHYELKCIECGHEFHTQRASQRCPNCMGGRAAVLDMLEVDADGQLVIPPNYWRTVADVNMDSPLS